MWRSLCWKHTPKVRQRSKHSHQKKQQPSDEVPLPERPDPGGAALARKCPYISQMVTAQCVCVGVHVCLSLSVCVSYALLGWTTPASDSFCRSTRCDSACLGLFWAHLGLISKAHTNTTHRQTHKMWWWLPMNPATPGGQNLMRRRSPSFSSCSFSLSFFVLLPDQLSSKTDLLLLLIWAVGFFSPSLVCIVGYAFFFDNFIQEQTHYESCPGWFFRPCGSQLVVNFAPGPNKCQWLHYQWVPRTRNTGDE